MSKKFLTKIVPVILFMVLLAGCRDPGVQETASDEGGSGEEGDVAERESVTFALSWLPIQDAVGWYSALENGYFEEENLDVEISRGFGSGDTAQRVATGESDFGVVDVSALVPMRVNEDLRVVAVSSHYAEPPHGIFYRPGDGIQAPADLEGRSVACSAGSAPGLLFPAFADVTGIDADAVEWMMGAPDVTQPTFLSGQADGVCDFAPNRPSLEAQTDDELGFFSYAEHGVSAYSQMVVVAERTIEERPDIIERFVRAAMRGNEFAVNNPQDAVDNLMRHTPDNDPEMIAAGWDVAREFMVNEDTDRHGFGYISGERMQATFDRLLHASDLDPGGHTAEDLYTTQFLP